MLASRCAIEVAIDSLLMALMVLVCAFSSLVGLLFFVTIGATGVGGAAGFFWLSVSLFMIAQGVYLTVAITGTAMGR